MPLAHTRKLSAQTPSVSMQAPDSPSMQTGAEAGRSSTTMGSPGADSSENCPFSAASPKADQT